MHEDVYSEEDDHGTEIADDKERAISKFICSLTNCFVFEVENKSEKLLEVEEVFEQVKLNDFEYHRVEYGDGPRNSDVDEQQVANYR